MLQEVARGRGVSPGTPWGFAGVQESEAGAGSFPLRRCIGLGLLSALAE